MPHFDDLSAYDYQAGPDIVSLRDRLDASVWPFLSVEATTPRVNIGWLGRGRLGRRRRFPTGTASDQVIDALIDVIDAQAVNVMRGFQRCEICPRTTAHKQPRVHHRERTVFTGSGEIRVPAEDGTIFAAPTLIGHYVLDHSYLPPAVFTDALTAFRRDTADLAQGWIPNPPTTRSERAIDTAAPTTANV